MNLLILNTVLKQTFNLLKITNNLGFWISCIYWTETRDFCTRQIFKGFLDFLTGMRVFCICWTFKGCQIFCTN
ncbi:uncharacterized protein OCT59_028033 [Rhizophagus irregularis]|uniref:uncharacterized protein n=1 Tax=Rhizophagus irregularis TaxID=588596 RepID=UPI000CBC896F|nr:hypothetical protein OCT59_028033 [Rhizophagus irregularis]